MGARTDTLQWGQISCSLVYLLLSIGSLEQFWNVIALKLRASFSARRSSLPFFYNGCLVLHGLYQAIISTVQQYPPTNNYTLHLHDQITATIHDPNLQQYNSTTPHYHRYSTVQPRTYHIHDSNLQQYLNNSTVPYIHRSAPISHTFLTALRSTIAARDLYCTPGTSINCPDISTLYRRYIFFYAASTASDMFMRDTYIRNVTERQFIWRSPSAARTRTIGTRCFCFLFLFCFVFVLFCFHGRFKQGLK